MNKWVDFGFIETALGDEIDTIQFVPEVIFSNLCVSVVKWNM